MNRIDKERLWVFSPVNNIAIKAEIKGNITESQLKAAIKNTINHYEMLNQKVLIDDEGVAYFEKTEIPELEIKPITYEWKDVVLEQQKIPFHIDKGEMIRFFYQLTESGVSLIIIVHHIAGDGISFTYFLQDIIKLLSGIELEYKKINMFDMNSLPKESKLRFPMTFLLKSMNKKWDKTGKIFGFDDYYSMYQKYWDNREAFIDTYSIENEDYDGICKFSKANKLTINTILTTAFIRAAGEESSVGMAASIREKNNTDMGSFATGISVKYKYDESKDFISNASKVEKLIYNKLNNPSKKYFLLQFMSNIAPTLIDAIYFESCTNYSNKTANTFSKMFGYNGNPEGISITNLTRLPIELKYKDYELTDFICVPPLVLNAKRIIGVASLGKKMVLSFHIANNEELKINRKFFNKAIEYLKNLY